MNRQRLLASTAVALLMCSAPALAQMQQKGGEEKAAPSRSGSSMSEQHSQQKQGGSAQEQESGKGASHSRAEQHGGTNRNATNQERGTSGEARRGEESATKSGKSAEGQPSHKAQSETGRKGQLEKGAQSEPRQKGTEERTEQKGAQSREQKGAQSRTERTEPKGREAQSAPKSGQPEQRGAETPSQQRGAGMPSEQRGGSARSERGGEMGKSAAQGSTGRTQLSEQQRSSVQQTLLRGRNVNRAEHVDFSINVGTRVPRSVRLAALPADVISLVPQFRGYRYFVSNDEICIVDPNRYEIVDVIGGPSQTAHGPHGPSHAGLSLTAEERAIVMRNVELDNGSTLALGSLSEGSQVPRDVRLRSFPERVVREVPKLQGYQYFTAENRVAIVDPQDDTVALVIRE